MTERYTTGAREISGFWFDKPGRWHGWRGTVLWGNEEVSQTTKMYGSERQAKAGAMSLRRRYQAYLDHSGRRHEIVMREYQRDRTARIEASKTRRLALGVP